MTTPAHTARGFSLLEMLVVIAITASVVVALIVAIQYVYRGQRFVFEQADATRSARIGIERAVADMREASYADNGAYPIVAMSTSTMTFYSDIDDDSSFERVRYFLSDKVLYQGVVDAAGTPPTYDGSETTTALATDVRNDALSVPLFTYYDADGNALSDLADLDAVAFVLVRLVVNLEPSRAPNDFELRASATLRNIE